MKSERSSSSGGISNFLFLREDISLIYRHEEHHRNLNQMVIKEHWISEDSTKKSRG